MDSYIKNYIPSFLIISTVGMDYLYAYGSWGNDDAEFIHLNGAKGFAMYWHVHQLSMMINWVILGCVMLMPSLRNIINQCVVLSYLLWKFVMLCIYISVGYSLTDEQRVGKMILFFTLVFLFLIINKEKWTKAI